MSARMATDPRIHQICPIDVGDFVTAFDIMERHQAIVVGMASGAVFLWFYDSPQAPPKKIGDKSRFEGRPLGQASAVSSAIRHIWCDDRSGKIVALVGFYLILHWNITDATSKCHEKNIANDFKRQPPSDIYVTHWKEHLRFYLVENFPMDEIKYNAAYFFNMKDLSALRPEVRTLQRGHQPLHTNENHLVIYYRGRDEQYCQIRDLHCKEIYIQIPFPRNKKVYWGFHLINHLLFYVSNQRVVKVWDCSASNANLEKWRELHNHQEFTPYDPETRTYLEKDPHVRDRLKGHKKHIAAVNSFQHGQILSLGSNRKLKIWQNDEHNHEFRKIQTIKNLPGRFNPGYTYQVKRKGDLCFYNSDDGVFMVTNIG